MTALALVTGPQQEPLTIAEVKSHCRVAASVTTHDFELATLIVAAREWCERETRRKLVTQTWDWKLDAFPDEDVIELPLVPVQSVTSVLYVDEDGVTQTVNTADYDVDASSEPARVQVAASGSGWPALGDSPIVNAVTVRFVVGYGLAAKVPDVLKLAMKLHVEAHFDRDEKMMPALITAAENLVRPYTYHTVL